jgi:glycosyltransferase involved in cell wall biosynthesis
MRVLKICIGTWQNASRDQRELGVCRELGADISVLAKGDVGDRGRKEQVNGFPVLRYTTRPYSKLPVSVNRVISVFQWAKYVSTLGVDVISGHDIGGWTIGWLSKFYNRKNNPLLIYDSHEFELGRNSKRNILQLVFIKFWEKKVIKKSAFTIVVNNSIADELVRIYKLKDRPVVVRNIPSRWEIDETVCKETRQELFNMFGRGQHILIYHGAICENRGIEQILAAIKGLPEINLLIVGNYQSEVYKKRIEELIKSISKQVIVKPAVPHSELWKYIGAADLCVAPIIPTHKSYYFALPNKLFEAIQARTPLLVSDLPEMSRIVNKYRVGETMNPQDVDDVRENVKSLLSKGKDYYRHNLEHAAAELVWDKEKQILSSAYGELKKTQMNQLKN